MITNDSTVFYYKLLLDLVKGGLLIKIIIVIFVFDYYFIYIRLLLKVKSNLYI